MIYLDNAATTGFKPPEVLRAVNSSLVMRSANPGRGGHSRSVAASESVYRCREKVSKIFNADSTNTVCFCQNCTAAINIVIKGVLRKGEHIIISSLEHNAVFRTVVDMSIHNSIEFDIASVGTDDDITLSNLEKLIKANTKMIFVTAASNVNGICLPLKRIGELCAKRKILFGVDGAQYAGVLPIDMKEMNIDYLCFAPHKGFYAPMGLGVLIARKPIDRVLICGGTGVNSISPEQPEDLPERIESGTLNLPAIEGFSAGIDFVCKKGIINIYNHEFALCKELYDKLSVTGVDIVSTKPKYKATVPIFSFNVKNLISDEVADYLNKNGIAVRAGLHCAPLAHFMSETLEIGAVRVSPSLYNTKSEINNLIFFVKRLI